MDENVKNKEMLIIVNTKQHIYMLMHIFDIASRCFKRIADVFIGLIGTLLLIPLTIILFILKIITGEKGNLFYAQRRIGKNGKEFRMYKYRTMVDNSDEILKKILEENISVKEEYTKYKKLKDDPRVTKIGKFLRYTSLDEFPQFFNVLLGNMSFIGSRPYLPREKEDMGCYYYYIIKNKPGITGLWQISGRSDVSFEKRLKLETFYSKKACLRLDAEIFFKTFLVVLKHKGSR